MEQPSLLSDIISFFIDGIVKSPDASLRFIPRHCDVRPSTSHSSGFARLACGSFYDAVFINVLSESVL